MKKLFITFNDTNEVLVLTEDSTLVGWSRKNNNEPLEDYFIDFDKHLPQKLIAKPIMFYDLTDDPILKLYRSAYIKNMEWID